MFFVSGNIYFLNQFLASFLAMLPGFTFGSLLAYAAVAVPQVGPTVIIIFVNNTFINVVIREETSLYSLLLTIFFTTAAESKFNRNSHWHLSGILDWWDNNCCFVLSFFISVTITQPTRVVGSLSTAVLQVAIYHNLLKVWMTPLICFWQDIIGRRRCLILCRSEKSADHVEVKENHWY